MEPISKPVLHSFENNNSKTVKQKYLAVFGVILSGIVSGYILAKIIASSKTGSNIIGSDATKQIVGTNDTKTFRDSAEGNLETGGINGEGTHKLIRPGGDNQTVYLTSSILDLSQFEGKRVKVWGETFAAEKAGWLMDVGKVELIQ